MNSVQEILGYTELHPEVIQKILDLYDKVEAHDNRIDAFTSILDEMKNINIEEIQRMIDFKFSSVESQIEENNYYTR